MVKPVDEHNRIDLAGGSEGGIHLLFVTRVSLLLRLCYDMMDCLARLHGTALLEVALFCDGDCLVMVYMQQWAGNSSELELFGTS